MMDIPTLYGFSEDLKIATRDELKDMIDDFNDMTALTDLPSVEDILEKLIKMCKDELSNRPAEAV